MKTLLVSCFLIFVVVVSSAQQPVDASVRKLTFGAERGFMLVTGDYKEKTPVGSRFDLFANYRVAPRIGVGLRIGVNTYWDNRTLGFIPIQAEVKGFLRSVGSTPFAIVRGGYSLVRPSIGSRGEVFTVGVGWRFMLGKRCTLSPIVGYHYQEVNADVASYDPTSSTWSNGFERFDPLKTFFVSLAFEF